jgi:hypothetical protein
MGAMIKGCLIASVIVLSQSPAMGQSGVISGPPQVKPEAVWIAVAGGSDIRGRYVGVGYSGRHRSRYDAEDAAVDACHKQGRGVRCLEAYAKSEGCLYIVPGTTRGGVTWGRGSTQNEALIECRRGGYDCNPKQVVGGCVDDRPQTEN